MGCLSTFFRLPLFAVIGTSNAKECAAKVIQSYKEHRRKVIPICKSKDYVGDVPCVDSLTTLAHNLQCRAPAHHNGDSDPHGFQSTLRGLEVSNVGLTILTPPEVTRKVLEEALHLGFRHFFLQPGSMDEDVQHYITAQCKLDHYSDINFIEDDVCATIDQHPNGGYGGAK